ncbi:MAG: DUF4838 domain-containing protein [Acidobacteriota bacterium]|nr:DUF4838 domain-containing protein [Acidobacteriota bacterium]
MRGLRQGVSVLALSLLASGIAVGQSVVLFDGQPRNTIVVPDLPSDEERYAADELRLHLELATDAEWRVTAGGDGTIHIGGTDDELPAETWRRRVVDGQLHLFGGAPRGTLYAVHRFLEDVVGVRWWTPWDTKIPHHDRLQVREGEWGGRPAFPMRDLFDGLDDPIFAARSGLNGHFTKLDRALAPNWQFGSPGYTHTFYKWIQPESVFDHHPEWFSEHDGRRFHDGGQLCLSDEALRDRIVARLQSNLALAPRIYSVSQNDWNGACECVPCQELEARAGGKSGAILDFVGEIASRVPELQIETLAYGYSAGPPAEATIPPNVILRHSTLKHRDFARPLQHPRNREHLQQLQRWSQLAETLWVWDYAVHYGSHGDMPFPRLRRMQRDLRLYERVGVQGIYYQHDDPLADDLRDLSRWLLAQWMVDPDRSYRVLVREFTDGFYGDAAPLVRRYLRLQSRVARRQRGEIRYRAPTEAFTAIDHRFLERAATLWNAAEAAVPAGSREHERVQHGRLTLDRATLVRYRQSSRDLSGQRIWPMDTDLSTLIARYRETWQREIERRLPESSRAAARAEVEREIRWFLGLN